MSEQEFDIYLSLLGKLLGLRPDQRKEISEELRDHLENRLSELVEAGHTKSEATRLALDEFGDAAGLANQFVSIPRQQRKRWVMRFATFSIAGCFLMALFVFSFWPEGGRVSIVEKMVAQNGVGEDLFGTVEPANDDPFAGKEQRTKERNAEKAVNVQGDLVSEEEKTRATEAKLNQMVRVDFWKVPLEEAIVELRDQIEVEFYIKASQLDLFGISTDQPVPNLHFESIRASMALDLLLHQIELDYVVRDGIVIVTSAEDVELTHEIRVYDCTDIANVAVNNIQNRPPRKKGGGGAEGDDVGMEEEMMMEMMGGGMGGAPAAQSRNRNQAEDLVGLISATVRPDSWEEYGGMGSISQFQGLIVINNNARAHRDTEKLLEKIRAAKKLTSRTNPFK